MGFTVQFDAGSALAERYATLASDLRGQALRDAVEAGALIVETDAKIAAPVLTGTLRRSLHTEVTSSDGQAEALVGTDVPYARRLEFGFVGADRLGRHYNQAARPYLRPALDSNRARVREAITSVLATLLSRRA